MDSLEQAILALTSATGDLDLIARFLVVDANEVADALLTVEPDSAEGVALRYLAKYNPVTSE